MQNYYAMAGRRSAAWPTRSSSARTRPASSWTSREKQEAGGEVAHSDVVKAQLQLDQRAPRRRGRRTWRSTRPASASPSSSSPTFARTSRWWTIWTSSARCPRSPEIETQARAQQSRDPRRRGRRHPGKLRREGAQAAFLPTFSADYFFGIQANQYALHNEFGQNNLGSSVVAHARTFRSGTGARRGAR